MTAGPVENSSITLNQETAVGRNKDVKNIGVHWGKLLTPLPNSLIDDHNALFGEQLFGLTEAEAETMVKPNGMTDNFAWKAMALVAWCWVVHQANLPNFG